MDAQKTLRERYLTLVRIIYLETFDPRTFRLQTPQKVRVASRQQFWGRRFRGSSGAKSFRAGLLQPGRLCRIDTRINQGKLRGTRR